LSANPMGELAEWIRLYRRAETLVPDRGETAAPGVLPPLPSAEPPTAASSPGLPNEKTLLYGTIPLIALTVPGILVGLGVTAVARRVRSASIRTPKQSDN